jgi:hypothetical protein
MRRAWITGIVLGFVVTLPAFWQRGLVGSAGAEVYGHAWVAGFVAEHWPALPSATDRLDPRRDVAWTVIDPLVTWTIAGLSRIVGLVTAWDLAAWAAVATAFAGGAYLARRTGGHWLIGGAIVALGPCLGAALASGLSEDWAIGVVAAALGLVAALDGRKEAVAAGILLGLCAWLGLYLALGAAIGAIVLGAARVRETRRWREMALAAAIAAILAVPMALRQGRRITGEGHRFGAPQLSVEPNWAFNPRRGDDLASFVVPWPWAPEDPGRPGTTPLIRLHPAYLGLVPLGLAAMGRRRRDLALLAVSAGLATGPTLAAFGHPLAVNPFVWALSRVPVFDLVNHWGRLLVPGQLALAAMAARGRGRPDVLAGLVAADAVLLSPAPWPVSVADAEVPGIYREIGGLSPGGLVVAPAAGPGVAFQRILYRTLAQDRPVAIDPDRPGYAWADGTGLADALRGLDAADPPDPDLARSVAAIREAGGAVLLVEDPYVPKVETWLGTPDVRADGGAAWDLVR